ncbi:MAG: xanthine dehydrogenase family protein molybdopterin-binding subunit [Alphaproteobacteria bacterium]|nr:xanthine dehydrogenase family protein molybdopterin-binding subunit [Alphaproteobacteria bacterium]
MGSFGNRVGRLEDLPLLRGVARFADDLRLPGLLHASFVRSSHGHAIIRGIDKDAALALPGVHAVFTAADFAPHLKLDRLIVGLPSASYRQDVNRPVLAGDEVVHVGEPIAIVIADNRYVAEDAASLVEVDYEPVPAIADARRALEPGSPKVHRAAPHNLLAEFDVAYGDADAAFAAAAHVFKEQLYQHRGGGHSIECRAAVARYDTLEDRVTLWSSTQTPHTARTLLSDILGWDETRVRVITPEVGGGFGPKLIFYPEDVAVTLAAILMERPVKWIEDRREHFVASTQERDQFWDIEIAVDKDARILSIRGALIHEHGAYTARGVNLPYESAQTVTLPYEVPAFSLNVKLALTNKVPVTPVRGAGQPQGCFAMERLLDRVARELKIDRAEVRNRNLITAAKMPYAKPLKSRGGMQVVLDSGDYPRCQAMVLEAVGWRDFPVAQKAARSKGRHIGIGLANFVKGTGRGPFEPVSVRIAASGKIHVSSGAAAMGQSTKTMLAQIVAEQLGGAIHNIAVISGDTAAIPMGIGGFNSRQAVMAGSSAHLAAIEVREKALLIASKLLNVAADELDIDGDAVQIRAKPKTRIALGDIARAVAGIPGLALPGGVSPGLAATASFVRDEMAFANGAAAAIVEVDAETGAVKILKFVIAHDCGRIINPMIVDGQIIGGVAHGIGNALFEYMGFDESCQPVTANFADYLLIGATETPHIETLHMESPSPLNPLGVKGVGECGVLPAAPAIISAIEDALAPFAVRIGCVPIAPGQIVAMIGSAQRETARAPAL